MVANVVGVPAAPGPSASGTIATVVPLVPTIRSPLGSAASSRAEPTLAITLAAKPLGSNKELLAGVAVAPPTGVAVAAGVAVGGVVGPPGDAPDPAEPPPPLHAAVTASNTETASEPTRRWRFLDSR